jgi:1-acyl-sn-glycerol-3-phosphate acyltransferase
VIWAANHLTLWDSFLLFYAVFPLRRTLEARRLPWNTPEHTNYYRNGGWFKCRAIRAFMYLCRCIPFLRGGEDEASVRWREGAFERCVWVLSQGGSICVFPEATRSRSGWFDASQPKDFLGSLALRVPGSKVLGLYLRGESQAGTTAYPARGETFRMDFEFWDPAPGPASTARSISEEMFRRIGALQERWFEGSGLLKNCAGNDIVDLGLPLLKDHFSEDLSEVDPDWAGRLLTPRELLYLESQPPDRRFSTFWRFHAAKEAASKALAQAGVRVLPGGFATIEADLFQGRVRHLPTLLECRLRFTDDDAEKLHCVAVLRGGRIGGDDEPGDVLWKVAEVPQGSSGSEAARELCLGLIAESSDDISASSLSFTEVDDIPRAVRRGAPQDWGVSLSHSGRFAAASFMVS